MTFLQGQMDQILQAIRFHWHAPNSTFTCRFKPDDEGGAVVTAAQVAMLGGQWRPSEAAEVAEESQPGPRTGRGKGPSKAMGVSEFLAKGEGATMLPRSKQAGLQFHFAVA